MKKVLSISFLIIPFLTLNLIGQNKDDNLLIPSVSAFTVGKGEMALNVFGSYSYDIMSFNFEEPPYRFASADFNSLSLNLQATLGVSTNNNFNLGIDLNQLSTFESGNSSNSASFLRAGPRVRWRPLGELGNSFDLIMQNSLLFSLSDPDDLFGSEPEFRNQLIASKFIRLKKFSGDIILQATAEVGIQPRSTVNGLDERRPITSAWSFLAGLAPNENWLVFGAFSYSAESANLPWVETDEYFLRRSATSLSAGVQFILARKHALFFSHTFLLDETRGGGANAASLGLRLLFLKQYSE